MTDRARELTVRDLEKLKSAGNDPGEVLLQSVKNSWQGVFALKDKAQTGLSPPAKIDADRAFHDMAGMVKRGIRSQKTVITNADLGRMVAEQLVTEEQAQAYGWIRPGTHMAPRTSVAEIPKTA